MSRNLNLAQAASNGITVLPDVTTLPAVNQVLAVSRLAGNNVLTGFFSLASLPQLGAMPVMIAAATQARTGNPNLNPVMTSPPVITDNAAATGTLTNVYSITTTTKGVFNQYGGVPTDDGNGFYQYNSFTFSGAFSPFISRIEISADAAMVEFFLLNMGLGIVRFIVNGQYVSKTPLSLGSSARHVRLDFTTVGGRAKRTITVEAQKFVHFNAVSVGATETVTRASGKPPRMYVVGDSYTQAAGASIDLNCYAAILPDLLGIKDVWNGGVGGTGFLATSGGTQLTFRQRLSDLVTAAPDLLLICGGLNDMGATPAALSAEVTAYLSAIRATPALASIPIVLTLNAGNTALATSQPRETAMSSAMAAFGDPMMFFIPNVNDLNGPCFTGTGHVGATTGSGNCDVYIGSDGIHPNDAGHAYMAAWIADAMRRVVFHVI
jgi:lysophospholipase L1-like esterase